MSYRDVSESLRAYRDRVAADLEQARAAANEARDRAEKVRILEKELAETEGLLAKVSAPRSLPLLENVAIAAPCSADWEQMVGDERVRFCGQCEKNVYNLSAMPRDEAEALLSVRDGRMCVRLYKRADGTVMTSDCAVGVKRRNRRRAVAGVLGGGLLSAGAALATAASPMRVVQGAPPVVALTGAPVATAMGSVVAPTTTTTPPNVAPVPLQGAIHSMKGPTQAAKGHDGQWLGGKPAPIMGDVR